jgi:hypothetical protein
MMGLRNWAESITAMAERQQVKSNLFIFLALLSAKIRNISRNRTKKQIIIVYYIEVWNKNRIFAIKLG